MPGKTIIKIAGILWIIIGVIILLWTGYWYYMSLTIGNLSIIATIVLMGIGLYALMFYLPITILLVIIYFILKYLRLKKRSTVEKNQAKKQRSK